MGFYIGFARFVFIGLTTPGVAVIRKPDDKKSSTQKAEEKLPKS